MPCFRGKFFRKPNLIETDHGRPRFAHQLNAGGTVVGTANPKPRAPVFGTEGSCELRHQAKIKDPGEPLAELLMSAVGDLKQHGQEDELLLRDGQAERLQSKFLVGRRKFFRRGGGLEQCLGARARGDPDPLAIPANRYFFAKDRSTQPQLVRILQGDLRARILPWFAEIRHRFESERHRERALARRRLRGQQLHEWGERFPKNIVFVFR